jgi:hypothetical protein
MHFIACTSVIWPCKIKKSSSSSQSNLMGGEKGFVFFYYVMPQSVSFQHLVSFEVIPFEAQVIYIRGFLL